MVRRKTCSFRNCTTSSKTHLDIKFFRYPHPVKHKERFENWIKYSKKPQIKKLQVTQILNRFVCAQHFRDECFMNYLKNKLTQSAVPTLDPLSNGMVLDYEADDNPKPIKLIPSRFEHLRSPTEKTSSCAEDLFSVAPEVSVFFLNSNNNSEILNNVNNSSYNIYVQNYSNDEIALSSDCFKEKLPEIKEMNLSEEITQTKFKNADIIDENVIHLPNKVIERILFSHELITDFDCYENHENNENLHTKLNKFETKSKEKEADKNNDELKEKCCEYEKTKQEFEILKEEYANQINQQKNEIMKLKIFLKSKENAIKKLTTNGATKRLSLSNNGLVTKAQIFKGVRKYLSPSMSALVRMKMYAAPERQWKSDEKQCSVELMKLGKNVYKYFRNKWRCRLPSNKVVKNWMNGK